MLSTKKKNQDLDHAIDQEKKLRNQDIDHAIDQEKKQVSGKNVRNPSFRPRYRPRKKSSFKILLFFSYIIPTSGQLHSLVFRTAVIMRSMILTTLVYTTHTHNTLRISNCSKRFLI